MDKLEKVIKGLECCTSGGACQDKDCPYIKYQQAEWCKLKLDEDALELLKKQQPKTGQWIRTGIRNAFGGIELVCSVCDDHVIVQNVADEIFCRHCGAKNGKAPDDDE